MTKLNQLLAIEKGVRTAAERSNTDLHHQAQKAELFQGRHQTYRTFEELKDGEPQVKQPDKVQFIQVTAEGSLTEFAKTFQRMFDVVASKDKTNTQTNGTVVVDSVTLMKDVPVSFLIYMEKQLNDIETFVRKIHTLPTDQKWTWDTNQNCFVTEPIKTFTTKKVPKVLLRAPATDKHPAQTEVYQEDVQVGEWTTILQHAGLPAQRKQEILNRITKVKEAVKMAREAANQVDVHDVKVGEVLFKYLFQGT